ncbi:putative aspartyl protease [Gregarina niphandrodes]|uniref:Aspartyl protease n=1 Tax=Gregarina niphandrodes TaxID=110365 RepID=A0A023AZZ5_GRENI|nr:putative aspartyl protease [Gregarina niphandrodes]EZG44713.1 putative aspartyl protease [Gregarina niphandrodes]|eukprot:XP_011134133.1 putative aspartyl protease [Gregarina niphandrodes]
MRSQPFLLLQWFSIAEFAAGEVENFKEYQKKAVGEYLPALPLRTKVFGSIFQTAYYFIDIFLGAPHPHEFSMIIDTGSSTQGLPCSNCQSCGSSHWEKPYDITKSEFNERIPCGNCTTCRLNTDKDTLQSLASPLVSYADDPSQFSSEAAKLLLGDADAMQCLYNVHYAEGSRLQGLFYNDVMWMNIDKAKNKDPTIMPPASDEELDKCPAFPLEPGPSLPIIAPVGCHIEETHLFHDQKASGILGLEFWGTRGITTFPTSILNSMKALYQGSKRVTCSDNVQAVAEGDDFRYEFALCLSPKGGSMSFGGPNSAYHAKAAKRTTLPLLAHAWKSQSYTVGLTHIHVMKNATLSPVLHSPEYFALQKNDSMWIDVPLHHPAQVTQSDKKVVAIVPTLVDSGTTLTYLPPRLFGEILFHIENRVAVNTGIRDRQRYQTRSLGRVSPESLFSAPDTTVVLRERFMSEKERGDQLEFIPVATAAVSTGPKRLIRVSAVDSPASTADRRLRAQIRNELARRLPQPGRRLSESRPTWYAVLEPSPDPLHEPLDALVGFLDVPESMEGAAPRALISKLDGYNNGECWWLQDKNKDLPLFPMLQFTFSNGHTLHWHPLSYMYSGSNQHFWCLAIMTDAGRAPPGEEQLDSEAIFGSNSFIYHDVIFRLSSPPALDHENADDLAHAPQGKPHDYTVHPSATVEVIEADCPLVPIDKASRRA